MLVGTMLVGGLGVMPQQRTGVEVVLCARAIGIHAVEQNKPTHKIFKLYKQLKTYNS